MRQSAWGAIQVKDGLPGAPLFHSASVGDWVTLSNVYVEEFRGNTILQCLAANNPTLTVLSRDNPLPEPVAITPEEIAAPIPDAFGDCYVKTHDAEKYEHMRRATTTRTSLRARRFAACKGFSNNIQTRGKAGITISC